MAVLPTTEVEFAALSDTDPGDEPRTCNDGRLHTKIACSDPNLGGIRSLPAVVRVLTWHCLTSQLLALGRQMPGRAAVGGPHRKNSSQHRLRQQAHRDVVDISTSFFLAGVLDAHYGLWKRKGPRRAACSAGLLCRVFQSGEFLCKLKVHCVQP